MSALDQLKDNQAYTNEGSSLEGKEEAINKEEAKQETEVKVTEIGAHHKDQNQNDANSFSTGQNDQKVDNSIVNSHEPPPQAEKPIEENRQADPERAVEETLTSLSKYVNNTENQQEITSDDASLTKNFIQEIRSSVVDESTYKKNRVSLLEKIKSPNKLYSRVFVDTLQSILLNEETADVSKFIGLYFLKEAMDLKVPELVQSVEDKMILKLGSLAESRESDIASSETVSSANSRKNFHQLLFECIYFWNESYGTNKDGSLNNYKNAFYSVRQNVAQLPKNIVFFAKNNQKLQEAKQNTNTMNTNDRNTQPQQMLSQPGVAQDGDKTSPLQNLKITLQFITLKKKSLLLSLSNQQKFSYDEVEALAEEFRGARKEIQNLKDQFTKINHPDIEALVNRLGEECDFMDRYFEDYNKLKVALEQFKSSTLRSLTMKPAEIEKVRREQESKALEAYFIAQDKELQTLQKKKRKDLMIKLSIVLPIFLLIASWIFRNYV